MSETAVMLSRRGVGSTTPRLKLSKDRKTSPKAAWHSAAARWSPEIPNAFGLPAGASCPGRTSFCDGCYAVDMERYPSTGALVWHNFNMLRAAKTPAAMAALLSTLVDDFRREHARVCRRDGVEYALIFRIHWDGDFFSVAYARAWARVIRANPDIAFWAYTRSFVGTVNVVPVLADIANLALYLSVDVHNKAASVPVLAAYPSVRAAWCGETWDAATAVAGDAPVGARCPENTRKIPLVSDAGQGACDACGLCVFGRNNVRFSVAKGGAR